MELIFLGLYIFIGFILTPILILNWDKIKRRKKNITKNETTINDRTNK